MAKQEDKTLETVTAIAERVVERLGLELDRVEVSLSPKQSLVRVFVDIPKKLTDRQKELLREFEAIEDEKGGNKSFLDKILNYFNG